MARTWRLRHKLLVGLTLVLGSFALLLTGTIQGLSSSVSTMKTTDSKLSELQMVEELRKAVAELAAPADAAGEARAFDARITAARQALAAFSNQHADTVRRGRDPDRGFQESELTGALAGRLEQLEAAVKAAAAPRAVTGNERLRDDPAVAAVVVELTRATDELRLAIYNDMYYRIDRAKAQHRRSLGVVIGSCSLGVLLVLCLSLFFYRWVIDPVRDLHAGVGRLSRGDFLHPIRLHSGDELEELAVAFNDMTARLHAVYRDLARQVNDRSRQLVRSERMVSVGFLAAGVAHEINNPLASIAFCAEALERRLLRRDDPHGLPTPGDLETAAKYLTMIQQEAFRCKGITQRLLEFSRVGERRREPTDLAELVDAVLDIARLLPNCKGKQFEFRPQARLVASVNAEDVKSVVLNLVVNALDSMEDGGKLTITLLADGDQAVLRFADTGCGMPAEVLENIFEPFFTRSRTGKGTGLGLFISHQIIDQHGGALEAASPGPGMGSTFTVRVPVRPPDESPAADEPAVLPLRRAA